MDLAYDRIQEQSFPKEDDVAAQSDKKKTEGNEEGSTLSADVQDAYRAFSASPWGARIGGFFGAVAKQGESVYREAQHELTAVGHDASTGFTSLRDTIISRTRSLSLATVTGPGGAGAPAEGDKGKEVESTPTEGGAAAKELSTDEAIKESETVLSRLKVAAAQRLKDIQQAEDAADEALLKFGTNIRNFLRDSISIAGPGADGASGSGSGAGAGARSGQVLFESKDAQGKRVIHTSRFDAQLHVIHTNPDSFSHDPAGDEYAAWSSGFNIDKKTDDIAADLAKYPELRTTMEKLVPDQIPYPDFWKRYYFLRHSIETAEARRRDLLKAASAEEEVGWDEDSEEESSEEEDSSEEESSDDESTTATATATKTGKAPAPQERPGSSESSTTIQPPPKQVSSAPAPTTTAATTSARAPVTKSSTAESRRSNEDVKSQADSDASYDVVGAASGVPSQAPNSPRDASRKAGADDSDEEDWE